MKNNVEARFSENGNVVSFYLKDLGLGQLEFHAGFLLVWCWSDWWIIIDVNVYEGLFLML